MRVHVCLRGGDEATRSSRRRTSFKTSGVDMTESDKQVFCCPSISVFRESFRGRKREDLADRARSRDPPSVSGTERHGTRADRQR